ncbi:hypothetical protein JTL87_35850, partial [Pseudomonas aeruginosa]|nr:hypothetical protein [Pseudomonas aeruginosa]
MKTTFIKAKTRHHQQLHKGGGPHDGRRQRQAAIPALAHITPSPWRQGWRQLRRNRLAMFCLLLLAVMAVWCV